MRSMTPAEALNDANTKAIVGRTVFLIISDTSIESRVIRERRAGNDGHYHR